MIFLFPRDGDVPKPVKSVSSSLNDFIQVKTRHTFPCPLQNHDHEIAACPDFLTLTPKDRWNKIPKGRICYTCLKPKGIKGVCKTRRCTEEKTIPQVLLCARLAPLRLLPKDGCCSAY